MTNEQLAEWQPIYSEEFRRLVAELSEAEKEHLDDEGPLKTRLHRAIVAICEYAGVPNKWESS